MANKPSRRLVQQPGAQLLACVRCYGGAFVQELESFVHVRKKGNTPQSAIVRLQQNVFGSLADWLERVGWINGLIGRPNTLSQVRSVLDQLAGCRQLGDAHQLERASLVARYLIFLAAMSVDVSDLHQVQAATLKADTVRLPRYWPRPPSLGHTIWRPVMEPDCHRFLHDYRWFWSPKPRFRRPKGIKSAASPAARRSCQAKFATV